VSGKSKRQKFKRVLRWVYGTDEGIAFEANNDIKEKIVYRD